MLQKKGNVVLDIGPAAGNPRNSEGAFIDLKDGRLMFIYKRFIGETFNDDAASCLAARYSSDGGDTWSEDRIIATREEHNAVNLGSVSLQRMANGDIGCFYNIRYGWNNLRLHLRRSADEGITWGEPICCISDTGYYVTNNDRVLRLSSGRLIIPASLMNFSSGRKSKGTVHFFLSDDDGFTWREARNFCVIPAPRSERGLLEPGAIELKNGVVWAWSRTDMGYQYEMFSVDGGESWTLPSPSLFTSPDSPLSLKRIPGNGLLLAVWNPIPNYQTKVFARNMAGRTPLVGALSSDEGHTWKNFFALETEEDRGGYCYTAIHFLENTVLLAYCAGVPEDGHCLARLRMRKIRLVDII